VRKQSGEFRSRRELFAGALRYAALGLMAAGSAALFAKRQRLVREGKCVSEGICDGCKVLQHCSLPQAASARRTLTGVDNGKK
jgi:hypothetical protein